MSRLWRLIDNKKYSEERKIRIFLFINCLKYGVLGFLIWLVVKMFALNTWEWALCFICYPGFLIGYIGSFIFLCLKNK